MTVQQHTAQENAQEQKREHEDAAEEMRELEAGKPPTDLDLSPVEPPAQAVQRSLVSSSLLKTG